MPVSIQCGKNADWNKVMKINERWEYLKEASHANIQREKGDSPVEIQAFVKA